MKKFMLVVGVSCSCLFFQNSFAQTPFPENINVAITKPGMNTAAKNYTIYTSSDASVGTFTNVVTITPTYDINGIGLNPIDHLVYGASYVGNSNDFNTMFDVSMFRIGMDGTLINLGKMPVTGNSGSGSLEFVNFSAGAVSLDGKYYYLTYAVKPAAVTRIMGLILAGQQPDLTADDLDGYLCWINDISSLPENASGTIAGGVSGFYQLDFSDPEVTAGINAFLGEVNSNYPNVFQADGGIQDIAINPIDTKVYGYISYPDNDGNTVGMPVVFNAPDASGMSSVSPVGTTVNDEPGQEVAGLQFDPSGNFYGLFTTGDYATIDLNTGELMNITPSNITTINGNLRGDLAQGVTNIPFPIKLVTFYGKPEGDYNKLLWVTASEQNNAGFEIERSLDANKWTLIGSVKSAALGGNSDSRLEYSFNDMQPVEGSAFYRLKQTDLDGKITYSKIIKIANDGKIENIVAYPNPTKGMINLVGLQKGDAVKLVNQLGAEVKADFRAETSQLDISYLPNGMYFLYILQSTGAQKTIKINKY